MEGAEVVSATEAHYGRRYQNLGELKHRNDGADSDWIPGHCSQEASHDTQEYRCSVGSVGRGP